MKKKYLKPETKVYETVQEQFLLSGSVEGRGVEGGPTSEGVPPGVGETSGTDDAFGNHGQDGNSTRAPGFFGDLE